VIGFAAASSRSHVHSARSEQRAQAFFPGEARARTATIKIEHRQSGLGERMTGKVRFGEQVQPGHAARLRELVPHRLADDAQAQIRDDFFANTTRRFHIAKKFSRTTFCVDYPLCSNVHLIALEVPSSSPLNRREERRDPDDEPSQVTATGCSAQGDRELTASAGETAFRELARASGERYDATRKDRANYRERNSRRGSQLKRISFRRGNAQVDGESD